MAERVHGIRLRVYEYRTLVCPMPPREASDARKTPVPVLIDSSLKQRERERERKEDDRSLSFSLSYHLTSKAAYRYARSWALEHPSFGERSANVAGNRVRALA